MHQEPADTTSQGLGHKPLILGHTLFSTWADEPPERRNKGDTSAVLHAACHHLAVFGCLDEAQAVPKLGDARTRNGDAACNSSIKF